MPTIHIEGHNLFYEQCGRGAPIIFLHGNPGTHRVWHRQVAYFCDRFSLFALDMRGFGESDKPLDADYHPFALAREVAAFSSRLELHRPILVGLSMGSMVALSVAMEYPSSVRALVLVGSTSDRRNRDPVQELNRLKKQEFDHYVTNLVTSWYSPNADPRLIERSLVEARESERHVREATILALSRFNVTDRLHEIRVPTLIMAGDKDQITPLDHARVMHEQILGSKLAIFKNGYHMFLVERADEVNSVMESFLESSVDRPPSTHLDKREQSSN